MQCIQCTVQVSEKLNVFRVSYADVTFISA